MKNKIIINILKCDFISYSPSDIGTINTANSQIYIKLHREDSVISLLKSCLGLYFDVLHAATNNSFVDNIDIRLVNLGPIALFSNYKVTNASEKHLKDNSHADIVFLRYKLITSARDTEDLFIGFDRDGDRRQRELTNNKTQKGNFHLRFF